MADVDTRNDFLVGMGGGEGQFVIALPPTRSMTRDQALRLAAWLVALADPMERDFPDVFRAVCNT